MTTDTAGTAETTPEETFDVAAFLTAAVPMVRTLNLEYVETTAERVVMRLADQAEYHNHLGGPHAGAMFTLAESASGAITLAAFGDQMHRAVPLPVHAEIDFKKVAQGAVTATATLGRPIADVVAELDGGQRPEFPVTVSIQREDGAVTAEMSVIWTLRPNS